MNQPEQPSPFEIERQRNLATADAWTWYADHRERITSLLAKLGEEGADPSLCILGAGNLNDVELRPLASRFSRIDLVDWDLEAMQRGLQRQAISAQPPIELHGPIDLSGISPGDDVEQWIRELPSAPIQLPRGDYGVVASLCLLSQLIDQTAQRLGTDHPQLPDIIQAIRSRHLQLLAEHVRPGGTMLLVTDFVSSDTCQELLSAPSESLAAAAANWLKSGNFFTGLHPGVLYQLMSSDPATARFWRDVRMLPPWRWRISERRAYAVCALVTTRSAE